MWIVLSWYSISLVQVLPRALTDWNRRTPWSFSTILQNKTRHPILLYRCGLLAWYGIFLVRLTKTTDWLQQKNSEWFSRRVTGWLTGIIGGDAAGSLMPSHHLLLPGGGVWCGVGGYPGCISGSCFPDLHAAPGLRHGGHAGGGLCRDGVHWGWWWALLALRTLRAGATGLVGRLQCWGRDA